MQPILGRAAAAQPSPTMTRRLPGRDDAITCTGRRSLSLGSFVTGRDDGGILHHQNDRPLGRTRAMNDPLGTTKPSASEIDRAVFEVDDEVPVEDKEELIVIVVFVPVILALHDPQSNHRVVDLAERLIVPLVRAGFDECRNVHQAQGGELDVQMVA